MLLHTLGRTWRFEVTAEEGVTPAFHGFTPGREIYCFWHQCVLACAYYYRSTHATIVISQSFDGELITRVLALFGYSAVRGSSSRGGAQALLGLQRVLDAGRPAIFTADGPRGPIHRSKHGPIQLARLTGAHIGCFHLHPERCWTLRSWDRFQIPRPFTRIVVSWGPWLTVPSDANVPIGEFSAHIAEDYRQRLDQNLELARHRAEAYFHPSTQTGDAS
jgi:lysophospholipid acyltransferase (LPLAT)-like uncharacterized protein